MYIIKAYQFRKHQLTSRSFRMFFLFCAFVFVCFVCMFVFIIVICTDTLMMSKIQDYIRMQK